MNTLKKLLNLKWIVIMLILFIPATPSSSRTHDINTKMIYTYEALTEDLYKLSELYPDMLTYKALATTTYGRKVWAVKLGHGKRNILIHGAHHAREWMTSALLMKMLQTYLTAYENNQAINDFSPNILNQVSIWFVPMVNPDGVTLQQFGLHAFPANIHWSLVEMNEGSIHFVRWKANIHGIDLNRQYPANWENLKGVNRRPNYQFYKGRRPLEAVEVKALVEFTRNIKPEIAVSYHSSGNVIFWGYHQWGLTHTTNFTDDYYTIAEKVSDLTNYELEEPAFHQQGGGFTDWFIEEFEKPAFTIEIGSLVEDSSLPLTAFPSIWEHNKAIGLFLAEKTLQKSKE
ncbi:hypothetical protein J27TS8_17820 [Robertmurraya siralis]|uniref:Peptidase M14 domain-containing protein n=1 Tax=Robertmurraya siralis TaxID=77777 RepID=A0A920BTF4_9BACI|nr:M14 family metallocarboxypeptidase [Robertmurraya siralis]PAE18443.1 peptidase M14 [Bacillus sp. 7504-2]GIN61789.1 hypothetical protein J27TS8_17820 [Robertmurraya siralis]